MSEATPHLTTEQEAELRALSAELAARQTSPWQPACIAAAFATPRPGELVLTMQQWIDLEAIRSPLLVGELPQIVDLEQATVIFGLDLSVLTAEEMLHVAEGMLDAVQDAFAMGCSMRPPEGGEGSDQGFGSWLPIMAFLVVQGGLSFFEAAALPVRKALPLIAAHRKNEGWQVSDTPYALRHLEGESAKEAV